jgi:hypothetical protein
MRMEALYVWLLGSGLGETAGIAYPSFRSFDEGGSSSDSSASFPASINISGGKAIFVATLNQVGTWTFTAMDSTDSLTAISNGIATKQGMGRGV